MALEEKNLLHRILKAISPAGARMFRQNTGQAWQGKVEPGQNALVMVYPGDIVIRKARPVRMGLIKGSSDLIGWHPVTITPAMVGKQAAIFTAFEAKGQNSGNGTEEQIKFVGNIKAAGGIAEIVKDEAEAMEALLRWPF